MQCVDVTDYVRIQVTSAEARASLPVVERDMQLVVSGRQRTDVDFAGQTKESAQANADVALGDAFAGVHVYDVYSEGMVFEEVIIRTADGSLQTQQVF